MSDISNDEKIIFFYSGGNEEVRGKNGVHACYSCVNGKPAVFPFKKYKRAVKKTSSVMHIHVNSAITRAFRICRYYRKDIDYDGTYC